jgi:ABC-type Fe3+-hydroxamate transport system substrate-binding protein
MKVKELIEQLQKFDPEQIVVVDGYETGYDEVKETHLIENLKKLPDNKAYYDGEFQEATALTWSHDVIQAVYIPRSS